MSNFKKDFFATKVVGAIKKACDELEVPQEKLQIDVLETGSMGIFGLIKKKAHIRVRLIADDVLVNDGQVEEKKDSLPVEEDAKKEKPVEEDAKKEKPVGEKIALEPKVTEVVADEQEEKQSIDEQGGIAEQAATISHDDLGIVREELEVFLDLMGISYELNALVKGTSVKMSITSDQEDALIGTDGRVLDSLQYLLRKMIVRKTSGKVRLTLDVGTYRSNKEVELRELAASLALKVTSDGKTQAIPALSPSERRMVHTVLRESKEIRSRSVGEGHFKKVLIYQPYKNGGKKKGGYKKKKPYKKKTNT